MNHNGEDFNTRCGHNYPPHKCKASVCGYRDLLRAVIAHHAQKADDRCIEDDDKLYSTAGLPPCDRRVGSKEASLPMQPIIIDIDGIIRFKPNRIVQFLLDWATPRGISLTELTRMEFTDDERTQFAQLIGYSVSGFGDLPYVSDEAYAEAAAKLEL